MDIKAKVDACKGWGGRVLANMQAHRPACVLVYVSLIAFHFLSPFVRVQRCEQSGLLPTCAEVRFLQSSILQADMLLHLPRTLSHSQSESEPRRFVVEMRPSKGAAVRKRIDVLADALPCGKRNHWSAPADRISILF